MHAYSKITIFRLEPGAPRWLCNLAREDVVLLTNESPRKKMRGRRCCLIYHINQEKRGDLSYRNIGLSVISDFIFSTHFRPTIAQNASKNPILIYDAFTFAMYWSTVKSALSTCSFRVVNVGDVLRRCYTIPAISWRGPLIIGFTHCTHMANRTGSSVCPISFVQSVRDKWSIYFIISFS